MRNSLLVCLFMMMNSIPGFGQNTPAIRQFYFNPYLFNPAYVGTDSQSSVSLFYRQQWLGFTDAPSAGGFSLQHAGLRRVSWGLVFLSQEAVVLNTQRFQGSIGYRIPLHENHSVTFGLAGMAGLHHLSTDADYSNDPAILNATGNTFFGDVSFGLLFNFGRLRFGFAMPHLLGHKYFSPKDLPNVRYAQLRNQFYSLSYKFLVGDFAVEPFAMYRLHGDLQNGWEGATLLYYKEKIWIGAAYHQTQGLGFYFGMELMEKLNIGYSFELPPVASNFPSVNSHEIQCKWKFGEKRSQKRAKSQR
jgi:type IX secretion system PorP/SprF family membrane protein